PSVRGVVALAPWFPEGEPVEPLRGKRLLAAHGSRDRITSPDATRRYVERAWEIAQASYADMGPTGHYLLRRADAWNRLALEGCLEILA
ncbi:MAG: alpha/beta hydrolase, partial [Nocardioides sp.]